MLPVHADEDVVAFVTDGRKAGLSAASIAAALNKSPWAGSRRLDWNWQHVAALCWLGKPQADTRASHGESGLASTDGSAAARSVSRCDREDCDFHRLQALLCLILTWAPFGSESAELIANHTHMGDSAGTISARLNRSGFRSPAGGKWSASLVRLLIGLYAAAPSVLAEQERPHVVPAGLAA